jgi:hypothetical protein
MIKEKSGITIPPLVLWALTIACWTIHLAWFFYRFGSSSIAINPILVLILLYFSLIVFIVDMVSSKIYNRVAWVIMLMVVPYITFPVYLLQKKRLIRIQQRKDNFTNKND